MPVCEDFIAHEGSSSSSYKLLHMMSTAGDACPLFQHFSLIDNWCLQQRPAVIYPAQVEQVADRLASAEPQSITLGQAKVPAANYQMRKKKKRLVVQQPQPTWFAITNRTVHRHSISLPQLHRDEQSCNRSSFLAF